MVQANKSVAKRSLVVAILVILASGWLGALANALLKQAHGMESPGTLVWLLLPLLVVLVLRGLRKTLSTGRWRPRLRESWKWYLFALFPYPVMSLIVIALVVPTGQGSIEGFSLSDWMGAAAMAFAPGFVKNIFEESVWRGYLSDEMNQLCWKDWQIYLVAGGVWGAWHLPYYAFFLPRDQMAQVADVSWQSFAALACVVMILWGVLFTELFRLSGSVWPVVLLHSVEDAVVNPLVIDGHLTINPGSEWLFSPVIGLIPATLLAVIGLWLRNIRRFRCERNSWQGDRR